MDSVDYEFETFSNDILKAGTYPLRLSVRYEGEPTHYTNTNTLDFVVQLVNPCIAADLTISTSILSSTDILYEVFDSPFVETFPSTDVASTETTATCPPVIFTVTDQQGNALPSPLFVFD